MGLDAIQIHAPSDALKKSISFYWTGSIPKGIVLPSMLLPPTGDFGLLIFYGNNPLKMKNFGDVSFFETKRAVLVSQYYRHLEVLIPENFNCLGIYFKPTVLPKYFGIAAHELTHKLFDVDEIFGNVLNELIDQVINARDDRQRLSIVDAFFCKKLNDASLNIAYVDDALSLMYAQKGMLRIEDLSEYFKCSNRHLEKKFMENLGISPKYMSRIIQFNHMLSVLKQNPNAKWSDLAHVTGYYDQAHLIRSFVEFTGFPPTKYSNNDNEITEFYL
jgi:AraC-like DNA-binding protein